MSKTSTDDVVRVGTRVRVRDADGDYEFTIVAECEADALADRVSAESPLGRAILGHRAGDRVMFRAPGGIAGVTVVTVG